MIKNNKNAVWLGGSEQTKHQEGETPRVKQKVNTHQSHGCAITPAPCEEFSKKARLKNLAIGLLEAKTVFWWLGLCVIINLGGQIISEVSHIPNGVFHEDRDVLSQGKLHLVGKRGCFGEGWGVRCVSFLGGGRTCILEHEKQGYILWEFLLNTGGELK